MDLTKVVMLLSVEETLQEAYDTFHPKLMGIVGTCASMIIGEDAEADSRRFYRSEGGVTLVTRAMLRRLQQSEPELFVDFDNYKAPQGPSY